MTPNEFELLRTEVRAMRADVDRHFAQFKAKLDAKPSIAMPPLLAVTIGMAIGAALFAAGYLL
jgi:hypothetical protein